MAPSRNNNQFPHDAFQNVRKAGNYVAESVKNVVGSTRKSLGGQARRQRHNSPRRSKSEEIDPLDMAIDIQDHKNHHSRQSQERRFPGRFTDNKKPTERKRRRSQQSPQQQQQQQQQQQHQLQPQRKEEDQQLSFEQRNRNKNQKRTKPNFAGVESVLEHLNDNKSSATVDLCCSDNEDNATDDDDVKMVSKSSKSSKSKSGGKQQYHEQSERSSDIDYDDDDDDDDDEVEVVSKSSVSKSGSKQRFNEKSERSPNENEGDNESGTKHFMVLLDERIAKNSDDNVNNNGSDGGGRSNKINRDNLDRRENSNRSSDEESRTQLKRHSNNEETNTTTESCSNNEEKQSSRRQEKLADEGKKRSSDDEQKSNDEINSDSHRSDSFRQRRDAKVDKKRRPQSESDEPSNERNTESHSRNSKQPSQQQKKRGKSQKDNSSIEMIIPALKNSSQSFKNPRTDNSDSDSDDDSVDDRKQQSKPKNDRSLEMLKVVQAAESSDFDLQRTTTQRINRDSTPTDMNSSSASTSNTMAQNLSINVFNSLGLTKVSNNHSKINNGGKGSSTKGRRKKPKGATKIIVPGQAIRTSSKEKEDRDEYPFGRKGNNNVQYDDTNNWNAMTGSRYSDQQNTRSSSTRVNSTGGRATYGTSSLSMSQLSLNNNGRTRSNRRKANRDIASLPQESPRNNKQSRRNKTPETIDITNSDSEDDIVVDDNQIMEFTLKRLAINNRVRNQQDCQPMIKCDFESNTMLLSFNKSKLDVTKGRSEILIGMADVREMSYFEMNDAAVQNNIDIDLDLDSFIYLRAVAERPGARSRTHEYNFELEFEEDEHLRDLIQAVKDSGILTPSQTQPDDIKMDAKALIKDSRTKYKLRSQATPQKKDSFIANKKSDEILLVYPFGEDKNKIEAAASNLDELSYKETADDDQDSTEMKKSSVETKDLTTTQGSQQRSHQIVIRVEDYEKLEDGQWLNDSLVDFWMQWISRDINFNCKSTDVHFFTSHFHSTLASDGVEGVKSWTARKNINIFEKKLIFIPINKTLHWSLCVIVNPGAVEKSNLIPVDNAEDDEEEDPPLSCMLFFDSLKMHNKQRSQKLLLKWLNSEWQRVNDTSSTPFTKTNYKIYDPGVPRQDNGSDCGVFVCRYALAMFKLRHLEFTNKEAGIEKGSDSTPTGNRRLTRRRKTRSNAPFSKLITNGIEFDFNCDDIHRIRTEYQTFIRNLHPLYDQFNKIKIETEKEEKKARKESRRKGKVETTAATGPSSIDEDQKENSVVDVHTSTMKETKENSVTDIHTSTTNETKENSVTDVRISTTNETEENSVTEVHTSTSNETKENSVTDVRISTTNETSVGVQHPLEGNRDEASKISSPEGPPLEEVAEEVGIEFSTGRNESSPEGVFMI